MRILHVWFGHFSVHFTHRFRRFPPFLSTIADHLLRRFALIFGQRSIASHEIEERIFCDTTTVLRFRNHILIIGTVVMTSSRLRMIRLENWLSKRGYTFSFMKNSCVIEREHAFQIMSWKTKLSWKMTRNVARRRILLNWILILLTAMAYWICVFWIR